MLFQTGDGLPLCESQRCHGHSPPFSLGLGVGFGLAHTCTTLVVSGRFGMFQDVSGWAVNGHATHISGRKPSPLAPLILPLAHHPNLPMPDGH
jgi:hypothetical protein